MVKAITAYVSDADGRIFTNRMDAIQQEVTLQLVKILIEQGCNDDLAQKVVDRTGEIALLTEPLAKEIRKDMKARGG